LEQQLEQYRRELTGSALQDLGSPSKRRGRREETDVAAWRGYERFEGRSALRSGLDRCDQRVLRHDLRARQTCTPDGPGGAPAPEAANLHPLPEVTWLEPIPSTMLSLRGRSAEATMARETVILDSSRPSLQHRRPGSERFLILARASMAAKEVD